MLRDQNAITRAQVTVHNKWKIQAKEESYAFSVSKGDGIWRLLFNSLRLYTHKISTASAPVTCIRKAYGSQPGVWNINSKIFYRSALTGRCWEPLKQLQVPPHSIPYSHPCTYSTYNSAVGTPTDPYSNLKFWKSPVIFPHYTDINEEILTWIESFTAGSFSLEQMAQKQPR
jgi:hypothetical protein